MSDGDDLTDLHGARIATTEARLEGFYWVILGQNPPVIVVLETWRMVARRRSPPVAAGGGDRRQRAAGVQATTGAGGMSDLYNTDCAKALQETSAPRG